MESVQLEFHSVRAALTAQFRDIVVFEFDDRTGQRLLERVIEPYL